MLGHIALVLSRAPIWRANPYSFFSNERLRENERVCVCRCALSPSFPSVCAQRLKSEGLKFGGKKKKRESWLLNTCAPSSEPPCTHGGIKVSNQANESDHTSAFECSLKKSMCFIRWLGELNVTTLLPCEIIWPPLPQLDRKAKFDTYFSTVCMGTHLKNRQTQTHQKHFVFKRGSQEKIGTEKKVWRNLIFLLIFLACSKAKKEQWGNHKAQWNPRTFVVLLSFHYHQSGMRRSHRTNGHWGRELRAAHGWWYR